MSAMNHLVDTYLDMVSRMSFRILCDRNDSEAVTKETFVYVWNNALKYDGTLPLDIWLMRITSRYARLRIARRNVMYLFGQHPDLFVTTAVRVADYDDYVTNQAWELYCRASEKLSVKQRIVFTLYVLQELPVEDISMITELSRKSIANLLSSCEGRIRKELHKYGKSDDYEKYIGFLRKVAEILTDYDKLKRMIMTSIR